MKKEKIMGLFLIMGLILSACTTANKPESVSQMETADQAETASESEIQTKMENAQQMTSDMAADQTGEEETVVECSEGLADNFSVDINEVQKFGTNIMSAVEAKDMEALAGYMSFPCYVSIAENGGVVGDKEAFLTIDAEKIFTQDMQNSISKADVTKLQPSMAGFTLMDETKEKAPSITFGLSADGTLGITGINY